VSDGLEWLAERAACLALGLVEMLVRHTSNVLGLVIVFHEIAERTGDPARELVPAHGSDLFEQHLQLFRRWFRLVKASDVRAAALSRRRGEPIPLAITFDDDLRSHVEYALPILRRHRAPATFFLCGAAGEDAVPFWWETLQAAVDEGIEIGDVVPAAASRDIHAVARVVEELRPDERADVSRKLSRRLGRRPGGDSMSSADVQALVAAGFEIGFHTLQHARLPTLADPELESALYDGRERLAVAAGQPVELIAYPHGVADARVAASARGAGYQAGFTTRPEVLGQATDPWLIPRIAPGFRSRAPIAWRITKALVRGVVKQSV
jgi:peptidoglycan/xylan/chitin deacetylase (PgdA/CDA1 family)